MRSLVLSCSELSDMKQAEAEAPHPSNDAEPPVDRIDGVWYSMCTRVCVYGLGVLCPWCKPPGLATVELARHVRLYLHHACMHACHVWQPWLPPVCCARPPIWRNLQRADTYGTMKLVEVETI